MRDLKKQAFLPLTIAAETESLFDYELRVAEKDGQVVGFSAYTEGEPAWLYVAPESMRGGIGAAPADDMIARTNKRTLCVEVLCGNDLARKLHVCASGLTQGKCQEMNGSMCPCM